MTALHSLSLAASLALTYTVPALITALITLILASCSSVTLRLDRSKLFVDIRAIRDPVMGCKHYLLHVSDTRLVAAGCYETNAGTEESCTRQFFFVMPPCM